MKQLFFALLLLFPLAEIDAGQADSLIEAIKSKTVDEQVDILIVKAKKCSRSDPFECIILADRAVLLAGESNDNEKIANAYRTLGIAHYFSGNIEKSIESTQEALRIYEELDDKDGIGSTLHNLGNLHREVHHYEAAFQAYEEALEIYRELDARKEMASCQNSLGDLMLMYDSTEKAKDYFRNSLSNFKNVGDSAGTAHALLSLGNFYDKIREYDRAIEYYSQAREIQDALGMKYGANVSLFNIGRAYFGKGDYDKALENLAVTYNYSRKSHNKGFCLNNLLFYSDVYAGKRDYEKALMYQKKAYLLNDSLIKTNINKDLSELQVKYQTERKERQNEALRRKSQRKENLLIFLLTVSALALALFTITYLRLREKKKSNLLLDRKNKEIEKNKEALEDYSIKLGNRNEELLELNSALTVSKEHLIESNNAKDKYLSILKTELDRAAGYVSSLLPAQLKQGSIRTEWKFVPSRQIGGDSFGYHWIDENHFAIYLIDVSGHGVGAALHSVAVLNVLKFENLPKTDFKSPEQVLSTLNKTFRMKEHHNFFFTIWYGVYNPNTRKLVFSSAGHPPALILTKERELNELHVQNYPVGGVSEFEYSSSEYHIPEESCIYIYSDGVYEIIQSNDDLWSIEKLKKFLLDNAGKKTSEIDELYRYVLEMRGRNSLDDDFSMLKTIFL